MTLVLRRAAAYAIDMAIAVPMFVGGVWLTRHLGADWGLFDNLFLLLCAAAYFGWFEGVGQASPGKRLLRLRVVRRGGEPITPHIATMRTILFLTVPYGVTLLIDLVIALVSNDPTQPRWLWSFLEGDKTAGALLIPISIVTSAGSQGVHDLIARTVVLSARAPNTLVQHPGAIWSTSVVVTLIIALLVGSFWVRGFEANLENFSSGTSQLGAVEDATGVLANSLPFKSIHLRQGHSPSSCACQASTTMPSDMVAIELASGKASSHDPGAIENVARTIVDILTKHPIDIPWSMLEVRIASEYSFGPIMLTERSGVRAVKCPDDSEPPIVLCPREYFWRDFGVGVTSALLGPL